MGEKCKPGVVAPRRVGPECLLRTQAFGPFYIIWQPPGYTTSYWYISLVWEVTEKQWMEEGVCA